MSRQRRHFTADQKAAAVRRHLSGKEAVSDLADELGVQPSQIHSWVKLVLDQADKAFERSAGKPRGEPAKDRRIEQLQAKLATKNEVISELMEENVKAKKAIGELSRDAGFPTILATKSSTTSSTGRLGPSCPPNDCSVG
jgi:transposase-like protein